MQHHLISTAINAALCAGEEIMNIYKKRHFAIEYKEDHSPLTQADKAAHNVITTTLQQTTSYPILSEESENIDYESRKAWQTYWLIDPLDGTKEFIKRNGDFTVNIALIEEHKPILGIIYVPVSKTLYIGDVKHGAWKLENIPGNTHFESANIPGAQTLPLHNNLPAYTVVGSKSHMNKETSEYIDKLRKEHLLVNLLSRGSSLKICMVAEGAAHEYPRFGPTMEWDTAAGHAIAIAAGCNVSQTNGSPLLYNKADLHNPWFVVKGKTSPTQKNQQ